MAQSTVTVVINGQATSFGEAMKQVQRDMSGFSTGAERAERESVSLGERMAKTAEAVSLMGAESSEAVIKVNRFGTALGEAKVGLGSFSTAMTAVAGSFVLFRGIDFLKESVQEAMAGQQAWARLGATFKGNAAAFGATKDAIEQSSGAWAKYGETVGDVAGLIAQARGAGLSAKTILGDPSAIADLGVALKTGVGGAVAALVDGPRSVGMIAKALNLSTVQTRQLRAEMMATGNDATARAQLVLNMVEQSRFAGQGNAQANTAAGSMLAFQTSVKDLQETLGEDLLPALTSGAQALTGIVSGANQALATFGGLSGFLKTMWLPLLGGGITILLGMKLGMVAIEEAIRQRMRPSLVGAGDDARLTADAIKSIPTSVDTVATFDAAAASVIKDAYIDNIHRIPPTVSTVASFEPGNLTEATATPITVPVVYDGSLTESQGLPVEVPVVYDGSLSESRATPIKVPVIYNGKLSEARAIPERVPVIYNGKLTESRGEPVKVPVIYNGKLSEANSIASVTPVKVPVIYNGKLSESQAVPVKVPVIYNGKLTESQGTPVKVPVEYIPDPKHPFHIPAGGSVPITVTGTNATIDPVLGADYVTRINGIKTTITTKLGHLGIPVAIIGENNQTFAQEAQSVHNSLQTDLAADGPLTVPVKPTWAAGAKDALKFGAAAGLSIAITDMIVQNVHWPSAPPPSGGTTTPPGHGGKKGGTTSTTTPPASGTTTADNPLLSAMVMPHGHQGGMLRTSIQGQPTVKIAPHQQVGSTIVNTNPINITATRPIQTTLSGTPTVHITGLGRNGPTGSSGSPFYVHVLQGASNVAGDAAQYAMQAAIQAMIWGLLGKLGIGAGMAALVKMLKDITKGGGGKPGPGSPITDPALLLESAEMKEERKDKALRDALNAPGNRQPANSSTFILTGVQNYVNAFGKALATADWGAGLRAAGAGLAITAAIGGAILGGFKAMSTTPAVITGMSKAIGDAMVKAIANWDNPKNQGVLNQHKKGGPPVPGRWVGANYETTDSLAGNPPAPYAGYTEKYQQGHWWYDKKAGTPWHGGGTGFGTATQVPSSITDQLAAIIQTPKSSTLGGVHALRHTPTTVTNHNTINIYDANNPDKVRAVVVQALTEFSEGVRSQRRRAG